MSKESRDRFQSQATNEPALLPATAGQAAAGGGGGVGKFDAGNNPANTKAGAANNAAAPTTGRSATGLVQIALDCDPTGYHAAGQEFPRSQRDEVLCSREIGGADRRSRRTKLCY